MIHGAKSIFIFRTAFFTYRNVLFYVAVSTVSSSNAALESEIFFNVRFNVKTLITKHKKHT